MPIFENALQGPPPKTTSWNTVVSCGTYDEAQSAVDQLASVNFPVAELEIIGTGLRSVERVTGAITLNRTILAGAGSGAWLGLFVGLLVGFFTSGPAWVGLVVGGLLIGAAWGSVLAVAVRSMNRHHHNFTSLRSVVATQYDVIALDGTAERARSALGVS